MGPSVIEDIEGSLFNAPQDSALAHCVSSDLGMSAGIAKQFVSRWPNIREGYDWLCPGSVHTYTSRDRIVFNLITKKKYYHKPTYSTLEDALVAMKEEANKMGVASISIPEIGSGLDLLDPEEVREIINFVFRSSEIKIIMYHLYGDDKNVAVRKVEKQAEEMAKKTPEKRRNSLERSKTKETASSSIPGHPVETNRPSIPGLAVEAEGSKNKKKKKKKKKSEQE